MAKFCYWSVASGDKHSKMMQTLIKSARAVGVTEDFHVWTDKPIEGATVHESGFFDKHLYLFKFRFLKEQVQKLDYDYFVFIDADCFFVRNPGDVTRLCGDKGVFAQMENEVTGAKVKRGDWWSAPIPQLIKLMYDMGCEPGSKLYNTNAGFWIVKKDCVDEFYEMAMAYWTEGQKRGYVHFTEEPPLAFCGHVLGDPENMTLAKTSDVWVSDWTGQYAGRLPDGKPWQFEDYLNGEKIIVNPAIVHAMRSKDAMIAATQPKVAKPSMAEFISVETPKPVPKRVPQTRLPILMCAYGNFPHITITTIKQMLLLAEDPTRLQFMIGMNECGEETTAYLRKLYGEGTIEVLIESRVNRNKDPMMRVLIDLVEEPYFAWFDDDTFPTKKGWDTKVLGQINALHPFDAAGTIWTARRDLFPGYVQFAAKRPWFKSWTIPQEAKNHNLKHSAVFPHGAFWLGRADFLRQHNYPDRDMIKKCDDMLLGEMINQVGGSLKTTADCSVVLNSALRRGTGEKVEDGWKGFNESPQAASDSATILPAQYGFWIGHQLLGDVLGFCAAAHIFSSIVQQPVKVWFDPTRKDVCKFFDGVVWVEKDQIPNAIDCGGDPTLDEWPTMNGVKRFYRFMQSAFLATKTFDIHFNRSRKAATEKLIGLITHSNTQGDIDPVTLAEMLVEARRQYPEHKIVCFGNHDNTVVPEGVEDWRQERGDVSWIIEFVERLDLLITPQSGPCFIAAGWKVPMWVYRSKEAFWDYTLNYDTYKVARWWDRKKLVTDDFEVFDRLYQRGGWDGLGSGRGSTTEASRDYAWLLHKIISYTGTIKTILDIGCGDWQIMRGVDLGSTSYLGIDVAKSIIETNDREFSRTNVQFKVMNPVVHEIPDADLIILKDVLQHLTNGHIKVILDKLTKKKAWVLITNDYTGEPPQDIKIGDWRPVNVLLHPFNFPGLTIAGYNGKHVTISRFQ